MRFCSKIKKDFRPVLEELLYLNSRQHLLSGEIQRAIDRFGHPAILQREDHLEVRLAKDPDAQVVCAVVPAEPDEALAGVMIYTRSDPRTLTLIHIAVKEAFSFHGEAPSKDKVCFLLIDELRSIARRIRGIERIEMLYGRAGANFLAVRRGRG